MRLRKRTARKGSRKGWRDEKEKKKYRRGKGGKCG